MVGFSVREKIQDVRKTGIDWLLCLFVVPIVSAGLVTMQSFTGESNLFGRQLIALAVSLIFFIFFSNIDVRFLKRTDVLVGSYLVFTCLLIILFYL